MFEMDKWSVDGLKELDDALTKLGEKAGLKALRKAGREAMQDVRFAMAMGAGFDAAAEDGSHMRDDITITTKKLDRKAGKNTALSVRVGPKKKHSQKAIAQEYGTAKQEPDPFMRPALHENRQRVVNTVKTVLATEITKAIAKQ